MAGLNSRALAMAKAPKKPAKELDHIRVAEAENGGTTAYHHNTADYEHPPEGPHIFPSGEKVPVVEGHLFHHLAQHLNIPHEVMGKEAKPLKDDEMEEEEMEKE
jgi:hypothetical protein